METDYYRKVIKKYRKENKLSQEKLAELLGYDTTYMLYHNLIIPQAFLEITYFLYGIFL